MKNNKIQQIKKKITFRVAGVKHAANGTKIIFQAIGKSKFMECTPAEILSNDAFIERFSGRDIQKITYAQAKEQSLKLSTEKSPDLKLVQQELSVLDGRINFILKDKFGNTSSKSAAEIVLDKKIVNQLSRQEALSVAYVAGYEHAQNNLEKLTIP